MVELPSFGDQNCYLLSQAAACECKTNTMNSGSLCMGQEANFVPLFQDKNFSGAL